MSTIGLAVGAPVGVYRELATAVACAAVEAGHEVRRVTGPGDASRVDLILGVGYPHYFPWLAGMTAATRVAWFGEALPPPRDPYAATIRRQLPIGRVIDAVASATTVGGRRPMPARLGDWRERATYEHIQRVNLVSYRRAAQSGIRLVVTSTDRAASLRRAGVEAVAIPFGYHATFAGPTEDVSDARDVDVLIFGTGLADQRIRRSRIVARLVADLGSSVRSQIVDEGIWGGDRNRLIRRARVTLNVNRCPATSSASGPCWPVPPEHCA